MREQRYPLVPWSAIEQSDLQAQGDPETVVFLPQNGSLVGLHIKGVEDHVMLGIREDMQGHPISCAITNEVEIDARPLHSNPRRLPDRPPDYGEQ